MDSKIVWTSRLILRSCTPVRVQTFKICSFYKNLHQNFIRNYRTSSTRLYSQENVKTPQEPTKRSYMKRNFFIALGVTGAFGLAALYLKWQKELEYEKARKKSLGRSKLGGHFELIDQDGQPRTSKDFLGKWIILYFGFSHCPDICPEEMEKMAQVIEYLDEEKKKGNKDVYDIVPLFITVDPERDTPNIVKEYVKEFSPKIIGLTGTKEQIDKTTKSFRVYYSTGPRNEQNDYIVDHTIILYLINPDGEFVDYYGQRKDYDAIANAVLMNMAKYRAMKKQFWFL